MGNPRSFITLFGLLVFISPLRADNPPTYVFEIDSYAIPSGIFPEYIALDRDGKIYVSDNYNDRVVKFASDGTYLTQWGSIGSGDGQFIGPCGIAVDSSNNVYVADGNNRIKKFDGNGNYLAQWGSIGSGDGQFIGPCGIAIDSSNNIYVTDDYNGRVEKFDSNGNYLTQWRDTIYPGGIAIDSSNTVYTADFDLNFIEKFDSNGDYLTQWGNGGNGNGQLLDPCGIAIDSSNNVYVTDDGNNRVEKFDSNGNYLTQWGNRGGGNGQFYGVVGIAIDNIGNFIYVTDQLNNRIQVFANNTNIIRPYVTSQLAGQTVPAGVNVFFSVTVVGAVPLTYQWTSNHVALPGATNSTLMLGNVTLSDSATYAVLVTNSFGGTFSSNAMLTVMPALAATLPATGTSATGAVLNGSVTIGEDTVVWFDWGTDTNYGNIAGASILSNDIQSNNVSASLSGLNGSVYHYRIVAANDSGIVYGEDQRFTVGFVPTATTLSSVNETNGTILYASVNPEGWDTRVYFKWGSGSVRTNVTSDIDAGSGATSVNISSFITGLVQAASYSYQVVASNHLGTSFGAVINFLSFPFTSMPNGTWESVASSADGNKLVAVVSSVNKEYGAIYISTNSGVTWVRATNAPVAAWNSVASSADGTKLTAVAYGSRTFDGIYISTNSGVTWVSAAKAPVAAWNSVASSTDGTKLAAVAYGGAFDGVYISTNAGTTWIRQTNGLVGTNFFYIASSADGNKLIAAQGGSGSSNGFIFTSTNRGISWTQATNVPVSQWYSVASSANGENLLACAYSGRVYISTNSGVDWMPTALPTNNWNSVAESTDGTKLVALANSVSPTFGVGRGPIWTSMDSGNTWVSNSVASAAWVCAAMSADGNKIVASIGYPSSTGGVYISQTTPASQLNLTSSNGNLMVSWLIPSTGFALQQSPDLVAWSDVTNNPALNLTNLQNQVTLPLSVSNGFYRLTTSP
jgi:DNA-binding beta-propeller fold protein YncE